MAGAAGGARGGPDGGLVVGFEWASVSGGARKWASGGLWWAFGGLLVGFAWARTDKMQKQMFAAAPRLINNQEGAASGLLLGLRRKKCKKQMSRLRREEQLIRRGPQVGFWWALGGLSQKNSKNKFCGCATKNN